MEIHSNGSFIRLEDGETVADMHKLVCAHCGHTLANHSHTWNFGTLREWFVSQCILCGLTDDNQDFICPKFKVE